MEHKAWHHFLTITQHKLQVMQNCFRVGLFKQGTAARSFQVQSGGISDRSSLLSGDRSPNAAEREEKGIFFRLAPPQGAGTSIILNTGSIFPGPARGLPDKDAGQLPGGDGHGPHCCLQGVPGKYLAPTRRPGSIISGSVRIWTVPCTLRRERSWKRFS